MAAAMSVNFESLGDFRVTKDKAHELGYGAYGRVYRGARVANNDPVAIKIMTGYKKYMNLDELAKEADMLRKIPKHENIAEMFDYLKKEYKEDSDEDGVEMVDIWLVTELCTLGNLKKYASRNDLSIKKKIDLMFQAARALEHLHECKPEPIAHRDVKPENLLITETLDKRIVKLCDFGCARTVFREDGRSMTMKSLAGTKPYWAPEQHELHDGYFAYDKSVDTFSLGVSNLALLECSKGSMMSPHIVDEKPIGQAMFEMNSKKSKRFPFNIRRPKHFTINIDKSSDSDLVSKVKNIIKKMIVYKPSDRVGMKEVVEGLAVLRDSTSSEILVAVEERSLWVRVDSTWEQQADAPKEHPPFAICFCGVSDGLVALGGCTDVFGGSVSSMCHHFSVKNSSWKRLPDMPTIRYYASAIMLKHVLMVLGGWDRNGHDLAVCENLQMRESVWSSAASMMEPLSKPLVAVAAHKVYVVPRDSYTPPGTQMQQYDPRVDSFSWVSQLPRHVEDTSDACLVAGDDKLYLFGGSERLAIEYSPAANQWTQLISQPPAEYHFQGCCGVVHDGKLLLCGGSTGGNDQNLVEEFDVRTQQWKTTDLKLPFPFFGAFSHVVTIRHPNK